MWDRSGCQLVFRANHTPHCGDWLLAVREGGVKAYLFDLALELAYSGAFRLGGPGVTQLMDGDGWAGGRGLDRTH